MSLSEFVANLLTIWLLGMGAAVVVIARAGRKAPRPTPSTPSTPASPSQRDISSTPPAACGVEAVEHPGQVMENTPPETTPQRDGAATGDFCPACYCLDAEGWGGAMLRPSGHVQWCAAHQERRAVLAAGGLERVLFETRLRLYVRATPSA